MAKYGSSSVAFFCVDGFNLLGVTTDLSESTEAITEETNSLGDSWPEHTPPGLRRADLTASGFYDDASDSSNAALSGSETTSRVVSYGFEGNLFQAGFIGHEGAFGGTYSRSVTRGELHKASATWTVTGQKDEGIILQVLATENSTSATGSGDNAASSSSGGVGYLHVTGKSGTSPTLDVEIRHSADNSTFADAIDFAQQTGESAERKTCSGTVNRYVRCDWAIGGSSTPTFTFFVGFARG